MSKLSHYLLTMVLAGAQQPDPERQAFWDAPERDQAAAAVQLVAERNPFTQTLLRMRGMDLAVWHERRNFDVDRALDLNPEWLAKIRDNTGMPNFKDKAPDQRNPADVATFQVFCQAVLFANQTPLDAFIKSAEDNKYVTFGHLWRESARYRGQVIPIHGELLRLRREDAPFELQVRGIKYLYEGWIKGPTEMGELHPFCVVFPIAAEDKSNPAGILEPAETMSRKVTFYGYYFKKHRYPIQEVVNGVVKHKTRDTPLLIGPTLILNDPPPRPVEATPSPFTNHVFIMLGGMACMIVLILGGLTWWFRRGDRQFHARLRDLHTARAVEMFEEPETPQEKDEP